MWKYVSLVFVFLLVCSVGHAQELSVEQLEKEWKVLYYRGCKAFDEHELDEAENLLQKSIILLNSHEAETSNSCIYSIMKLAEILFAKDKEKELESLTGEMVALKGKIRPGSKKFLNYLYCLALYYSNTGQYLKSIATVDEGLGYSEALAKNSGFKEKFIQRKALCYYCLGDIDTAIATERLCVANKGAASCEALQSLVYYLYRKGNYKEMEDMLPACFKASREPVLRKFSFADASERNEYWSKAGLFFTDYLPLFLSTSPSQVTTACCYDGMLLAKGVLLAASNKTSDMVLNSGDGSLVSAYKRYLELKGKKDRNVDEDAEMSTLSDVFIRYQKEHKNEYRKDFRIGWADVRQSLNEGDLAIEFVQSKSVDGYVLYGALTLKKDYTSPHYTRLCEDYQIQKLSNSNLYTSPELYDLVWKPLEKEMDNATKIYFSPTGFMYKTGIEYLQNDDGLNIGDVYTMYRLSSTKELVLKRRQTPKKDVALFGGINYDMSLDVLSSQKQGMCYDGHTEYVVRGVDDNLRSIERGGKINYLPGTKEEVDDIANILKSSGYKTELFEGNSGSEMNFKALEDQSYDVLHIATHGFYYSNTNNSATRSIDALFRDINLHFKSDDVRIINEDKMLTRSGLVFAGANNVVKGLTIPKGVDDGVLYADEIASINMNGVSLVVLSACQSGLGDISNSEGVFGLQRGFKLAGASAIIMSLWKVDDQATRILMINFYKNLVSGKDYRQSLSEAQMSLRLVDNGKYDDPIYWAAFVLLDGI